MSKQQKVFGGIGALAVLGVLALGIANFSVLNSEAQQAAAVQEPTSELIFRCGPMARQRGTEAADCAERTRPESPEVVHVTPLSGADEAFNR
jgi:hypothetical protein